MFFFRSLFILHSLLFAICVHRFSSVAIILLNGGRMYMHCRACAAPLDEPEFKGPSSDYCKYCADANGKLKPRGEVQRNIAGWLKSWDTGLSENDAMTR